MSRWHASSCSDPRVVVQQQQPYCESCDSHPDIDSLVAAEASKASPIPTLPPDEPPGQMHLWWPPCVPYVTRGPDGHSVLVQRPDDDVPTSTPDEEKPPGKSDRLYIYPQRLKDSEFRVMCLYPVEDVNAPIHVTLEVYDDLRYHEYETVSYTWGGENGDSRLTQPVYVGPFWDILIQTHNCWEMLRHMRPWKGVRTIWVDAICINQADMQERQEQVAKMGQIYEKARQLVIYLGPDLVPPTSTSSPYPKRHHLQELDSLAEKPQLPSASLSSSRQWTLSDVLRRQYFRRLWIVQELIMSRNITIRVGDIDFIVDQAVCPQTVQACDKPWFSFITRKSIGNQSENALRKAVELVAASRASDPRDKIFGILGLIDSGEHRLAAAYSISFRHLVIGYYAYCLLVKKDIRVIIQASSFRSPKGMPSWAPPAQCDAFGDEHLISSTGSLQPDWFCGSRDFLEAYSRHHDRGGGDRNGNFGHVAWPGGLTRHTCHKVACEWINTLSGQVWFETCWHSQTSIDSSTGAFNLTAVHIMSFGNFDFSKAEIEKNGEVHVHTLKVGTSTLYIYANECIFDPADESDKIHLFALCDNDDDVGDVDNSHRFYNATGKNGKSRLCVLQQINDETKYRLLSASVIACFLVLPTPQDVFDPSEYFWDYDKRSFFEYYRFGWNLFTACGDKQSLSLPLLRADSRVGTNCHGQQLQFYRGKFDPNILTIQISQPITNARQTWAGLFDDRKEYNQVFDPWWAYSRYPSPRLAFPTITEGAVFLQVFQSILDAEKSGSSVEFFNIYFKAVREFHPELIQWKSRRRNTADDLSHAQDRAIDVVQLRFEPNQHKILEDIFDMIQEDLRKSLNWPVPPAISEDGHHNAHFHPPFLRIGWRDLALNHTNQDSNQSSSDDEDVYGFYPLDAINEALDKERLLEDDAMDLAMSAHGYCRPDPIYDDSVIGSSLSLIRENKGQTLWVAFDILSLTLWAQIHPYMAELRGLSRFCKDGENEKTRLLRPQTEEEERLTCLNWPIGIMEDFKVDGELRHITII